jgi:DNA-binding IclR family transcriptional regulator
MDIVDFLAAFPARTFSLSEIARAAKINVASCHAVLNALASRGYVTRSATEKAYGLGPALVAVGQAALKSQPLIVRAQDAAKELSRDLDLPVLLTTLAGDDILAVASIAAPSGRKASMRVGQRLPLVPPIGAPFLAWSSQAAIETWIARMAPPGNRKFVEEWRQDLALVRKRGYQVTLRTPNSSSFAALMADMASNRKAPEYKDRAIEQIHAWDERIFHPKSIEAKESYLVALIAAPIFDLNAVAVFCLCLVGFSEKITGSKIKSYAGRLTQACLRVMRNDRAA